MSTNTTTRKLTGNTLGSKNTHHASVTPSTRQSSATSSSSSSAPHNHNHLNHQHQHPHQQQLHHQQHHSAIVGNTDNNTAKLQSHHQDHHRQHQLQHQHQPLHSVPPRYQPPPHPPNGNAAAVGILKTSSSSSNSTAAAPSSAAAAQRNVPPPPPPPQQHLWPAQHQPLGLPLNIKYPPDVPKLTAVYIPDSGGGLSTTTAAASSSVRAGNTANGTTAASKGAAAFRQQLHHRHSLGPPSAEAAATAASTTSSGQVIVPGLLQRHPTAIGADELRASLQHHQQQVLHHHHLLGQHHHTQLQQLQQQQLQQHEMLKFVRKPDHVDQQQQQQRPGGGSPATVGITAQQQISNGGTTASSGAVVNGANANGGVIPTNGILTNGVPHGNGSNVIAGGSGGSSAAGTRMLADQSRQLQQSILAELRSLKEANQRLSDDNQELRDLCCFLDDDRQKGRKLAREWQRFGRYTASVMRQEVSAYQNKLRQLDDKQQELIRDNLELKELCLYMDEERTNAAANLAACSNCGVTMRPPLRDDGDGSSSSTNADEPTMAVAPLHRQFERPIPELNIRPTLSDQTLQYVRSLERKIRQLEMHADGAVATNNNSNINGNINDAAPIVNGRPEAVVRALQILEVREQIERDRSTSTAPAMASSASGLPDRAVASSVATATATNNGLSNGHADSGANGNGGDPNASSADHMDDGEKALVREMCNVVWRKLEDSPNGSGLD